MKTRAYLKVTSDTLLSEQMVEVLCIVPDRTWKTGDIPVQKRTLPGLESLLMKWGESDE